MFLYIILKENIYFFSICGTLHSVDQYLNIKLVDISVTDPEKYPHMVITKKIFVLNIHYNM